MLVELLQVLLVAVLSLLLSMYDDDKEASFLELQTDS